MAKGPKARNGNAVEDACRKLGGVMQAAVEAKVRYATMHDWKKAGAIRLFAPGLRVAKALGIPVDPRLWRLAGTDDE
jgi:hypothetical protein